MEKYTGLENNIQENSIEERNIALWENLYVLPTECETTKLTSDYIKSICKKLYRQKGNEYAKEDFFDKNFQIIIEDTQRIQASLIYKNQSKDGRNILHVTKGLMHYVQNEAQLASIIAHELGHFEVNETYGKDKNNVDITQHEHEMQADYRGFQSMLQAGYNPDETVRFFEIIQESPSDVRAAFEAANDEHGSTATRIANIKDYKSMAEVNGVEFSEYIGEKEFNAFQEKFMAAAAKDHYISYFEEKIRQEYNIDSSHQLSLKERWKFCEKIISEEPESLTTNQRYNEFAYIFNRDISKLSKEEAIEANRILQKIYAYEENQHIGNDKPEGKFTSICASNLPTKDENGNYYIKPYGQIAKDIEYRNEIISIANEEEAKEKLYMNADSVVKKLEDISRRKNKHFAYPEFSLDNLQVGQKAPWAEISTAANVTNKDKLKRVFKCLGITYDYFEHQYGNSLGYPLKMENNIYVDSKGTIISTNPEEVSILRAKSRKEVANLSIDEHKRQMKLDFHDQLAIMAQSKRDEIEYNNAKKRAAEIYKESRTAFIALDNTQDFLLNAKSSFEINRTDKAHPSVQIFDTEVNETSGSFMINQSANPKYAAQFYPQYVEVVLETELENIRDVYHSDRYPKVEKAMGFVNDIYNNLLNNTENMDDVSHEIVQKMASSVFKAYGDEMKDSPGRQSVGYFNRAITQTLLNDYIGINGNLPYVEEFRQREGITDAYNTDELIANLEKMKPNKDEVIYADSTVGYSKLLHDYEVIRTINAGVEIDVNRTLNAISGTVSPYLADKMTDYVIQNQLFAGKGGESAEQTYDRCKELYITMSAKEAFTQKENMQRQFESKLLDMMQQLPPERRSAEAYDLLSTHANHEQASREIDNSFFSMQTDLAKSKILAENLKELSGSILQYDGNKQIAEKIYADYVIHKHGPDDKSQTYHDTMISELDTMSENFSSGSRKRICQQIAKGVMAQKELAFDIKDIHDKEVATNMIKGEAARGYNLTESYMRDHPEFAKKTIDFLLSDCSNSDCQKFSADLSHEYNRNRSSFPQEWKKKFDDKINNHNIKGITSAQLEKLQIPENSFVAMVSKMHEEYRNSDFEERAAIMHRMLDYYGKSSDSEQSMQKKIAYVSDKVFGTREEDKDLLKEVKIITTAVCHQEEQPSLLLGAVLAGREPGQTDEKMNVGDGLAMFCEKKGTAWVKLAQTLSYVDSLPQDVRDSLGRLKDKANEPKQWEIYQDLEEAMPESELARIKRVQKFIGGGTFNKTILVDVEDAKTGEAKTKVVQVMHDRAATKSECEFTKINNAINELCAQDSKYEILKSVAERSAKNAKIEVDIKEGANQYRNACMNYNKIDNIELNEVIYVPKVATWERYGESKFSNYKIMEMAPGKSIDSPEFSTEQRRDMALAYTMIELTNLMGGKAWDIDRHSKQQNFHITQNKKGQTVVEIGIFDTGAQRAAPTNKEKELLGKFLISCLKEQQKGEDSNLSEFMLAKIKKFEQAGQDVNYVSDVQRGLLAISDVMKHMNTPQNPNGMADGLKTCFGALYKNGLIDKKLYNTLVKETAKSALTSPKFGKSIAEALLQNTEQKDQLQINLSTDNSRAEQQIEASVLADKPVHETQKIEQEKTRIKPKPLTPAEQVHKTLGNMGLDKQSYMLLTPNDEWLQIQYNQEGRSIKSYFNDQGKAAKEGSNMLMGTNNGYTAVYFAKENVYVVSPSHEFNYAMSQKAGCKNVGYGVMFSNGEKFTNSELKNKEWENIVQYVKKQEQQKEQSTINETAKNQCVSQPEQLRKDHKKILELSGRSETKHREATQLDIKTREQTELPNITPANEQNTPIKSEPQQTASSPSPQHQGKIAKMQKKVKWKFFRNLRKGINTVLNQTESQFSSEKVMLQTQNNEKTTEQENSALILQKNLRDSGMGM